MVISLLLTSYGCSLSVESGLLVDNLLRWELIIYETLLLSLHHIHSHGSLLASSLCHEYNAEHAAGAHSYPKHNVPEDKHRVVAATVVV